MSTLDIKNNAHSWGDFLTSVAEEAARDAASLSPDMTLHVILSDLALVAGAYAERVNLERGNEVKQPVAAYPVAPSIEAPLGATVTQTETPGWLLDTLADLHKAHGALEARVANLETRVFELERNQQQTVVTPAATYIVESENDDLDPAAWDNIDRARSALRGMVAREHRKRSAIRQAVLARVTSLAASPERNSAIEAELRQHSARAEELGEIDAIAAVKMDAIAALDDIGEARGFMLTVVEGWPQ